MTDSITNSGTNTDGSLCNTSSTVTLTNFFSWSCDNCKRSEEHKCSECGCNRLRCNKLNIIVEKDFYCKDFDSKGNVVIPQPYIPYYPVYPTYPVYPQYPYYCDPYPYQVWWTTNNGNCNVRVKPVWYSD
jgi:hypothetical protein